MATAQMQQPLCLRGDVVLTLSPDEAKHLVAMVYGGLRGDPDGGRRHLNAVTEAIEAATHLTEEELSTGINLAADGYGVEFID